LARIIGAVSTLLNPELVVIGGAVANSAGVLLEPIGRRLTVRAKCARWELSVG
jgi:predicted NBD/HSP70 family sugar kinase